MSSLGADVGCGLSCPPSFLGGVCVWTSRGRQEQDPSLWHRALFAQWLSKNAPVTKLLMALNSMRKKKFLCNREYLYLQAWLSGLPGLVINPFSASAAQGTVLASQTTWAGTLTGQPCWVTAS